jgi:Tim10/DDP family zinc finger
MSKVTENCFKVCTNTRGTNISESEKHCLHNCMDRYMDTMQVSISGSPFSKVIRIPINAMISFVESS